MDQVEDMEPIPAPPGQLLESSQQHLQTSGSPPSTSALVRVTSADSVHEPPAGFPIPAPGLGDTLRAATHSPRVQAGSEAGPGRSEHSMNPGHQFPEPGAAVHSACTVPPAPGVDPASMPFAGLLTSPVAPAAPAAVNSMMGGHGMVYVPGYGLVPVMPFAMPAGIPPGMPSGVPLGMPFPMHHQASASISVPVNAGADAEAPVMTAAQPAPPSAVRSFPQLSTFRSLEHLYEVVTCGDPVSSTLSFSAMTAADPSWRKGQAKRLFEIESAVKEMTERAAAESRQTGQTVSPRKHAKAMDVERAQHGSAKGKGATPVASWVKNVLGPLRVERNKQNDEMSSRVSLFLVVQHFHCLEDVITVHSLRQSIHSTCSNCLVASMRLVSCLNSSKRLQLLQNSCCKFAIKLVLTLWCLDVQRQEKQCWVDDVQSVDLVQHPAPPL